MMAGLFILLLISTSFAWLGKRKTAIFFYIVTLVLSTAVFLHHMTSTLNIQL